MNEKCVRVGRHLMNQITLPLTSPVPQLGQKFPLPPYYKTRIFIAVLTKA